MYVAVCCLLLFVVCCCLLFVLCFVAVSLGSLCVFSVVWIPSKRLAFGGFQLVLDNTVFLCVECEMLWYELMAINNSVGVLCWCV